ncbi:hypothetical protein V1264_010736 [Littorina saxatilis]|uniref:Dynein heavy chain tail domain-containing protein n=1 Tax=Littorina saxatilis TaxID=31220 RepID=A0AAN9AQ73_9CAEN
MPKKGRGKSGKKSGTNSSAISRQISLAEVRINHPEVTMEIAPEISSPEPPPPPPPPPPPRREKSMTDWIRDRVSVTYLRKEDWKPEHLMTIDEFVKDGEFRYLFFYKDVYRGFCVERDVPPFPVDQLFYFLKVGDLDRLRKGNFFDSVQYGSLNGDYLNSLLRVMSKLHGPQFFSNPTWTESMRNDFSEKFHRFMSGLTDTRWKLEGKTVLYIPNEGRVFPIVEAAEDKEYIQRMEVCMIHWSRQIKHVLNMQTSGTGESEQGPLAEVDHWKNRCADLTGITSQLDHPAIVRIISVLQHAKSNYITPFLKLAGEIMEGSRQAESNLMFLKVLKESCHEMMLAYNVL